MGLFGSLADIFSAAIDMAQDAEAISEAIDTMYSMCGNEGQTAILDQGMDAFESWARGTLSFEGAEGSLSSMVGGVLGTEKWDATADIWEEGGEIVAEEADSMFDELSEMDDELEDGDDSNSGLW